MYLAVPPPFCEAHALVASDSPGCMLVEPDMSGVYHEPFHVGLVDARIQQPLPNPRVAPADEVAVRVAPATEFRRQIAPRGAGPHDPEDCVDESPVVLGDSAPNAPSAGKERFDFCPQFVRKILTMEGGGRWCVFHANEYARKLQKCKNNLMTTHEGGPLPLIVTMTTP